MNTLNETLYQVTAPHYCAGFLASPKSSRVLQAAPILRWTEGRSLREVIMYLRGKGYRVEEIQNNE